MARAPGSVRDAIIRYLSTRNSAYIFEIREAIEKELGQVSASSVRSYLNLNVPQRFQRIGRGLYRLKKVTGDEGS